MREEIRRAFEASWARNERGYRRLAGPARSDKGATMGAEALRRGDLIQIDPEADAVYGGCVMMVETADDDDFAVGWIDSPRLNEPGDPRGPVSRERIPWRARHGDYARVGRLNWVPAEG